MHVIIFSLDLTTKLTTMNKNKTELSLWGGCFDNSGGVIMKTKIKKSCKKVS